MEVKSDRGICGCCFFFFFQAEDGIRDRFTWLEFRRVLFRSNSSHTLSSTPQTTQSQTPRDSPRPPNRFFSQEEGVWFKRRAEGCENGVMPISEVHEKLSSSQIKNVLALKGYSGRRLCYFVPCCKGSFVEDQGSVLEGLDTTLYATHRHLNFVNLWTTEPTMTYSNLVFIQYFTVTSHIP